MIHRPREFEEKVMGEFFKQTKLSSFKRQLNLYDFQRVTRGTDCGSYYHEMFLRGKPLLAKRMVRRKIKGTKNQTTTVSSSEDEQMPDFYSLAFVGATKNLFNFHHQTSARLALMERASLLSQDQMYSNHCGLRQGALADRQPLSSSPLDRLHGGGSTVPNSAHLGGLGLNSTHLGGILPQSSHHGPTGMPSYEALLNRSNFHSHLAPSQQSFLPPHDLPFSSLQHLQQQQQQQQHIPEKSNNFMFSDRYQSPHLPQQGVNPYTTAMENLNNSYALAANALKRNLDTPMGTQDEIVASKQLNNRPSAGAGGSTGALNYHSSHAAW